MTERAAYVTARLEQAGTCILTLAVKGTRPASYGSGWPDVVRDAIEGYGWTAERVRLPPPTAAQITAMDEAFAWLALIPADRYVLRRIVAARSLVSPYTQRHVSTWRWIGRAIGADHRAVQRWHGQGVDLIVAGLVGKGHDFAVMHDAA